MHENRGAFPLEDVRHKNNMPLNCLQYRFPGMRSDLGGRYAPADQGRGPNRVGSEKLSQIPLDRMYEAARAASMPLDKGLARRDEAWECFEISPALQQAGDAFLQASGTGPRALRDCLMDYLAWRVRARNEYPALAATRRASVDDREDRTGANRTLIDHVATLAEAAMIEQRLANARSGRESEALERERERLNSRIAALSRFAGSLILRDVIEKYAVAAMVVAVGLQCPTPAFAQQANQAVVEPGPDSQPLRPSCHPDPDAEPPKEPYLGYTMTGWKGGHEQDPIWHREVQRVKQPSDAPPLFRLKHRPKLAWTSLQPIDLGGATGFIATRDGCQQLLDRAGASLGAPLFDHLESEWLGTDVLKAGQALFRLHVGQSYLLARFDRGRLVAVSRQAYLQSYSRADLESGPWPTHLLHVVAKFDDGHGAVDMRSLREVVAPQWSAIAGIGAGDGKPGGHYLQVVRNGRRALYSTSGAGPLLEGFDSVKVVRDWFPAHPGRTAKDRAVLLFRMEDKLGGACRLHDMDLRPLISGSLTLGRCEMPWPGSKHLIADGDGASVHVYAIKPEGALHRIASIPGQVSAVIEESGLVLVRADAEHGSLHRLYTFDGRRFDSHEYSGFRNLGCRFFEVLSDGKWLTLQQDGTTSERRYHPFSC